MDKEIGRICYFLFLQIELLIQNILLHLIRQQVFDRVSFLNGLADKSCGNIQKRGFYGFDFGMLKSLNFTRSGVDKDLIIVQDRLMVFPLLEMCQIIRTQKKTKLMLWVLITQIRERVDGIARFRHPKLHIAGPEVEMICNCQLDHSQPVKLVDQGLLLFEGILGTDHKPNLVQVRAVVQHIGNDQVPDVDRIEASEVQPDLHFTSPKNPKPR